MGNKCIVEGKAGGLLEVVYVYMLCVRACVCVCVRVVPTNVVYLFCIHAAMLTLLLSTHVGACMFVFLLFIYNVCTRILLRIVLFATLAVASCELRIP